MQEKPKAILVDIIDLEASKLEAMKRLEELENLVKTFGGIVVVKVIQKRASPDYRTFVGKGKVEEIMELCKDNRAGLVIINNVVKVGQMFNLEEIFRKINVKVWDRIDLILQIFEKHAKSTEAKLQIELAGIKHMGPRIFGMGKELMQQKGGTAMRSGQGETNTEMMKRHLQKQELKIIEKLKHYELIREGHRKQRQRKNLKTVALVGYTNAGKSSLLKALTGKDVYIANELFATLDTRVGTLYIPEKQTEVLVSDTIGFIRDLPPSLIQAFKSTLAETIDADVILHVIDLSDEEVEKKIEIVEEILTGLGLKDRKKIYVFNKLDIVHHRELLKAQNPEEEEEDDWESRPVIHLAGADTAKALGWEKHDKKLQKTNLPLSPAHLKNKYAKFSPVFVSAVKKEGLEDLVKGIEATL